jgi:mono/diheme cytochrome c family protein
MLRILLGICGLSLTAFAADGAALFKARCAACHGADGAGKPAIKGSNLLTPEAKKATDAELTGWIMEGGPAKKAAHNFGKKGITADQAKALVEHIRTLQK